MPPQGGDASKGTRAVANRMTADDRPVHDWYRFVLSFPPHLVREYLSRFEIGGDQTILDPFCGTGTTLVECKKLGIPSVGVEAHPVGHFATSVKTDWTPDPGGLEAHAARVASRARRLLRRHGNGARPLRALPPRKEALLPKGCISPLPLHKTLVLEEARRALGDPRYARHELLALAKTAVSVASNLHFGPEVGVGRLKEDAPVVEAWLDRVREMAEDLIPLPEGSPATVHLEDARDLSRVLAPGSIDAVITSPPYPNEKDYTRATRLESVLLGFLDDRKGLQSLKRTLVRSNSRGVYKGDEDDLWIEAYPEIARLARRIESRRVKLEKTSGFERMYPKVTRLYFGGMARHLASLRGVLRPGALLAYVVGDQASFLRVLIRTGELIERIGVALGYQAIGRDLFRTRLATATREHLREEVVVLLWPG